MQKKLNKGYTFIELLVCISCASILMIVVWNSFIQFHSIYIYYTKTYINENDKSWNDFLLLTKKIRNNGGFSKNRF